MTASHVPVLCVVLLLTLVQGLSDASILDWLAGNKHHEDTTDEEREKIVPPGQNISLQCTGNGTLMWLSENNEKTFVHGNHLRHAIATTKYPPKHLTLDIINADFEDVGRYVCIENDTQLYDVYVYVFDTMQCRKQHLMVPVNDDQIGIRVAPGEKLIIPCRATHPDINVTLQTPTSSEDISAYDPRVGFTVQHAYLHHVGPWECHAIFGGHCYQSIVFSVDVAGDDDDWVSVPVITGSKKMHKAVGENVCLECSVNASQNANIDFFWRLPNGRVASKSERFDVQRTQKRIERSSLPGIINIRLVLYVNGLSEDTDFGTYQCEARRKIEPREKPKMDRIVIHKGVGDFVSIMMESEQRNTTVKINEQVQWAINYNAKPPDVVFKWTSPRGKVLYGNMTKSRFSKNHNKKQMRILLKISNVSAEDAGVYTLQATAGTASETTNLTLIVQYPPIVKINSSSGLYVQVNSTPSFNCIVNSYSTSNITWVLKECHNLQSCITDSPPQKNPYIQTGSTFQFKANKSGLLRCTACNSQGCASAKRLVIVSDVPEGLLFDAPTEVAVGDVVRLTCIVPRFNCTGQYFWRQQDPTASQSTLLSTDPSIIIEQSETLHSLYTTLLIKSVRKEHNSQYICIADNCNDGGEVSQTHHLQPRELKAPRFENLKSDKNINVKEGESNIRLDCEAYGSPIPEIKWSKDGEPLDIMSPANGTRRVYFASSKNMTLVLDHVIGSDDGDFKCELKNRVAKIQRTFTLSVKHAKKSVSPALVVPIIIICILLFCVVVYLARRVKREKLKVRTLTAQDVRVFLEGAEESIDPDMDLDQQADLLPYNAAYEYPREHLKLGRQLGAGAFGRVVRAEAAVPLFGSDHTAEDGGEKPAGPTIVAVKMVKPHAELTHLKALMTELKILIHVGKHLNVVNLLGACTTNLAKKELLVIVEYCCFGNLHSFLLRQRDNFVDQVDHLRDVFDFSIGSSIEPGRYQNLPTEEHRQVAFSEDLKAVTYEPEPHYATPGHDATRSTTTTTITDSTGAMSEHWTPKYRGDFKTTETSYVTTKDLVCWSYQVARGMEYLASRQVVHADLAARNLLLAENNVVKICDFGLARNLYKEANYLKKSDDPLPVKWMAIESIRDRVFSTQSDVWSFGIVLWEFFTLAMQPYPGIPLDVNFLPLLLDGHRMEKPQYCTLSLYRIIKCCWNQRPDERPNFTQLVAEFGHILDENVKQLYLELNGPYTRMNSVQQEYQNMIRKSRLSKTQAVDYCAKSQPVAHSSVMNDYQTPDANPRKVSVKDKSGKRKSKNVENLLDVAKDRPSGYINLHSDMTDNKDSDSRISLGIEETPQGYMRMSPSSSKHKSTHTIFSSEF